MRKGLMIASPPRAQRRLHCPAHRGQTGWGRSSAAPTARAAISSLSWPDKRYPELRARLAVHLDANRQVRLTWAVDAFGHDEVELVQAREARRQAGKQRRDHDLVK